MTRRLALPVLAVLIASGAACRPGSRLIFLDDHVESLGAVDTPGGKVEIGRRRMQLRPDADPPGGVPFTAVGPIGYGPDCWSDRAAAVPGLGVITFSTEGPTWYVGGGVGRCPQTHYYLQAPNPGRYPENPTREEALRICTRSGTVEVLAGKDPLRPDHVLVHNYIYTEGEQHLAHVFHAGEPPEEYRDLQPLFPPGNKGSAKLIDTCDSATVLAPGGKKIILDANLHYAGELPAQAVRIPIHDSTFQIPPHVLNGLYVLPSPDNPSLLVTLRSNGRFGGLERSTGMAPVMTRYYYRGQNGYEDYTETLVGWAIPQLTEQGVRWGFAKPDLSSWSGARWLDVRIARGFYLPRIEITNTWLIVQEEDKTWSVHAPNGKDGWYGSQRSPKTFLKHPSCDTAYNAAEAWCEQSLKEQKAAELALRDRLIQEDKERREQQRIAKEFQREQEERTSWWGTENKIFGQPREQTVGEWMEGRQREAIRDMKERGVYDQYGKPYNWLNKNK